MEFDANHQDSSPLRPSSKSSEFPAADHGCPLHHHTYAADTERHVAAIKSLQLQVMIYLLSSGTNSRLVPLTREEQTLINPPRQIADASVINRRTAAIFVMR